MLCVSCPLVVSLVATQSKAKQNNAKQCKAKQSNAKQCKAMQCKAMQSKAKLDSKVGFQHWIPKLDTITMLRKTRTWWDCNQRRSSSSTRETSDGRQQTGNIRWADLETIERVDTGSKNKTHTKKNTKQNNKTHKQNTKTKNKNIVVYHKFSSEDRKKTAHRESINFIKKWGRHTEKLSISLTNLEDKLSLCIRNWPPTIEKNRTQRKNQFH